MTKAATSANRIESVLNISEDTEKGTRQVSLIGNVEFKNVTATYQGSSEPSLEKISFCANAGQTIGIIGGTGSGKTTLINLIAGLYPTATGQVLIDGLDIRELDSESVRSQIGIVPQKAMLFRGTVRDNLLWGNENATDEQLWDALKIAQADGVIQEKEGMLDAPVSQGGLNFSGGQRQRLTIARALVRKPAILILDDSASALDYVTESHLRSAIHGMQYTPTTFIVSQRASSVRHADQILVLDDGEMVGLGTHDELLKSCDVYQEIYFSQFPKEAITDES